MPSYSATGLNVRLGTTELAGTITSDSDIQRRKGEAAKNSELVDKQLRQSRLLAEELVPFPGDTHGLRLNFLENVPFLQVETCVPLDEDAAPKALVLHVRLSEKTFLPSFEDGKAQHLLIDVFFNGELASSVLMHLRDINSGAKGFEQLFSGTRNSYLTERPWIVDTREQGSGVAIRGGMKSMSGQKRWEQISNSLLEEVGERGLNKWGERPPSGRYLKSLATMEMPERVHDMHRLDGKSFGVIDVVVTSGVGKKTTSEYLREPTRLVDDRYKKRRDSGRETLLPTCRSINMLESQCQDEEDEAKCNTDYGTVPLPYTNVVEWSSPLPTFNSEATSDTMPTSNASAFVNPRDLIMVPPPSYAQGFGGSNHDYSMLKRSDFNSFKVPNLPSRHVQQPFIGQEYATPDNSSDAISDPSLATRGSLTARSIAVNIAPTLRRAPSGLSQSMLALDHPPLRFPLIGPLPALRGPPPQVGVFSVSPHSSPVDPGHIDPDLPPSSILISRLVINGKHNGRLIDCVWPVPQRVAINLRLRKHRRSCNESSTKKRKHSPGSSDYSEHSTAPIRRRSKHVPTARLTTPPPTSPSNIDPQTTLSIDKVKHSAVHDGGPVQPVQGLMFESDVLGRALPVGASTIGILDVQGSKATPFILENPEELLRRQARKRRPSAFADARPGFSAEAEYEAPVSAFAQPSHVAAFLNEESSSLSSVPSSPEPALPCTLPLPQPLALPLSQTVINPTRPLLQAPLQSKKIAPTSASVLHRSVSGRAPIWTPSNQGKELNPCQPPISQSRLPLQHGCVIGYSEDVSQGGPLLRQVKSEKTGVFTEDMVVVGCRFFVTNR